MPLMLTNNATSLLAQAINSTTTTTIQITSGDEFRFPVADKATDKWFPVTLVANDGRREICKCTQRTGVNLTVERGYEGTSKLTFPLNSRVEVRMTAGALTEATSNASNFTKGIVPDAVLPPRLRAIELSLGSSGDCNDVTESGRYWCPAAVDHRPPVSGSLNGFLWCDVASASIQYQEWIAYGSSDERWRRQKVSAAWEVWEKIWNIKPDFIPIGTVFDFSGSSLPTGWLWCAGQVLNRAGTYAALYAVVKDAYKNNNTTPCSDTQFKVPDLRGRVVAGQDDMNGTKANILALSADTIGDMDGAILGNIGGAQTHTLTEAQLAIHDHVATIPKKDGAHTHDVKAYKSSGNNSSHALSYVDDIASALTIADQALAAGSEHDHVIDVADAGSGKAHNNVQPTIIMNKIIKYL